MSFGKPIVATKIKGSGVDWVNKGDITGVSVEPKNERELANAFVKILEDKNRYKEYSKNAFKRFNDLFLREKN